MRYRMRYPYDAISHRISHCDILHDIVCDVSCDVSCDILELCPMRYPMRSLLNLCDNLLPGRPARPRIGQFLLLLAAAPRASRGRLRANALFHHRAASKPAHHSSRMGGASSDPDPFAPALAPAPPPSSESESLAPTAGPVTGNWVYHALNLRDRNGCKVSES